MVSTMQDKTRLSAMMTIMSLLATLFLSSPAVADDASDGPNAAELEATLKDKNDPALRMELADIYRKAGMLDKAVQQYKTVAETRNIEPQVLQDCWYKLGKCHTERKDFVNASFAFNESLRIDRFNVRTIQSNIDLWQEVVKADPAATNHIGLAVAYQYQGDFVKACREYKEALKISPVNEVARRQMASLPQLMKDYRRDVLINEGADLHALGAYDQAIVSYEMASRIDPQSATALFDLGCVHVAKREYDKAREWYQKALAIDPKDERTLKALQDITNVK